ncbi:hypothetical protein ACFRCW_42430 [Streptomyces sp. NPDC056653]|uniref:hypothetical protein n=1 Tax=Streptomyces sp. NPDC056653 TaxID=3345894 RepID=UPI0036A95DB2
MSVQTDFRSPADSETARPHTDVIPEEPTEEYDAAAPYGRREDGTPKAKPGRKPGTPNHSPRARATPRVQQPSPQPRPKAKGSSKRPPEPDYRPSILGWAQILIAPMMVAGARSDKWLATAAVTTEAAPAIADVLHDVAMEAPGFAALLERGAALGPAGKAIAVAVPLAVQIFAIHGLIPTQVGEAMGARSVDEIVAPYRDLADVPTTG